MYEDWSLSKSFFQLVKGFVGCWSPGQRLGLASEKIGKGTGESTIVQDEAMVEI